MTSSKIGKTECWTRTVYVPDTKCCRCRAHVWLHLDDPRRPRFELHGTLDLMKTMRKDGGPLVFDSIEELNDALYRRAGERWGFEEVAAPDRCRPWRVGQGEHPARDPTLPAPTSSFYVKKASVREALPVAPPPPSPPIPPAPPAARELPRIRPSSPPPPPATRYLQEYHYYTQAPHEALFDPRLCWTPALKSHLRRLHDADDEQDERRRHVAADRRRELRRMRKLAEQTCLSAEAATAASAEDLFRQFHATKRLLASEWFGRCADDADEAWRLLPSTVRELRDCRPFGNENFSPRLCREFWQRHWFEHCQRQVQPKRPDSEAVEATKDLDEEIDDLAVDIARKMAIEYRLGHEGRRLIDPRGIPIDRWSDELVQNWLRRSRRGAEPQHDPHLVCIMRERSMYDLYMVYECLWKKRADDEDTVKTWVPRSLLVERGTDRTRAVFCEWVDRDRDPARNCDSEQEFYGEMRARGFEFTTPDRAVIAALAAAARDGAVLDPGDVSMLDAEQQQLLREDVRDSAWRAAAV